MTDLVPSIEIVWAGGKWCPDEIHAVRDNMQAVVELAEDGLREEAGVQLSTTKEIKVHRKPGSKITAGLAWSERDIDLFLDDYDVERSDNGLVLAELAATTVHELAHTERTIHRKMKDRGQALIESAATEGIAVVAENNFMKALRGVRAQSFVFSTRQTREQKESLLRQYIAEAEECPPTREARKEFWRRWLDNQGAYVVGTYCVERLMAEGHELSTLIEWPAEEIVCP